MNPNRPAASKNSVKPLPKSAYGMREKHEPVQDRRNLEMEVGARARHLYETRQQIREIGGRTYAPFTEALDSNGQMVALEPKTVRTRFVHTDDSREFLDRAKKRYPK